MDAENTANTTTPAPGTETQETGTQTTPPQPQAPVAPQTPSPAPVDSAKLKEEITRDVSGKVSEEVSKSVIQRIGEALGLTKKEEAKLPTDPESLKKIVDEAVSTRLDEFTRQQAEATETSEEEYRQKVDETIKNWYAQYNQLARIGKVPPVTNEGDRSDKGVNARKKIILAIGQMIEENKKAGVDYVPSIADAMLARPNVLTAAPPGADLPISGNTSATESGGGLPYKSISKMSFKDIATKGSS